MFSLLLLSLLACAHALLAAIPTGGLIALASQPQFWAVLLAPLNSVAVSVIKQPGTPKWAKVALMVVCSLGLGLLSVYAVGQFNTADLLTTFGLAIAATELAYRKLMRKTGVSIDIEALTILPWIHKAFLAAKAAEEAERATRIDASSIGANTIRGDGKFVVNGTGVTLHGPVVVRPPDPPAEDDSPA